MQHVTKEQYATYYQYEHSRRKIERLIRELIAGRSSESCGIKACPAHTRQAEIPRTFATVSRASLRRTVTNRAGMA